MSRPTPPRPRAKPAARRRGGRRAGSGRNADPTSPTLLLTFPPELGVKDELIAVAKQRGVGMSDVAEAVLLYCRGHYAAIAARMDVKPLLINGSNTPAAKDSAPPAL